MSRCPTLTERTLDDDGARHLQELAAALLVDGSYAEVELIPCHQTLDGPRRLVVRRLLGTVPGHAHGFSLLDDVAGDG